MYLLVFVTLVISIIGIYCQVLGLQAARFAQGQTTVAGAMLTWHETAVMQARATNLASYGPLNPYGPNTPGGCALDWFSGFSANPPWCAGNPIGISIVSYKKLTISSSIPDCVGTNLPACWTSLPMGYAGGVADGGATNPAGSTYTFFSIYYQPSTASPHYVMTFVPPPRITAANPAPGLVQLPGYGYNNGPLIGITLGELYKQLQNAGVPPLSYGFVTSVAGVPVLLTPAISSGGAASASLQYPIPTDGCPANCIVAPGSIAIISSP